MKIRICLCALLIVSGVSLIAQATPESIVLKFAGVVDGISDYQCRVNEWCTQGTDYEHRIMNFYFKKPRQIRIDIIEGNHLFDPGSVVVFSGGNEITGKKGGILSIAVLKLDKKNPMATTNRGISLDESDLIGILNKLRFHLKNSVNSVVIMEDGIIQLTGNVKDPSKNGGISREVLYFDPKSFLPLKMEGYEGNKLVMFSEWTGYIINAGLPVELFGIDFSPLSLKGMGIKTLE